MNFALSEEEAKKLSRLLDNRKAPDLTKVEEDAIDAFAAVLGCAPRDYPKAAGRLHMFLSECNLRWPRNRPGND